MKKPIKIFTTDEDYIRWRNANRALGFFYLVSLDQNKIYVYIKE